MGGKNLCMGVEAGAYKDGRNESGIQFFLLYLSQDCQIPTMNYQMALLRVRGDKSLISNAPTSTWISRQRKQQLNPILTSRFRPP
jgi:hypothetical protein